ncbi:MAG: radical SAM domain-containing protein [Limisphaerales bacterium]|nr:MAG: radical SAM domain-containing protein [Limisphaerales bacterium]KAG0508611.1 MAG: radical SAM domain-containing protein [Limisphaerales bacterium]TXT48052.1 MAG: radical SAM domain-containing protein [Limisphaerales bacterium]
MPETPVAIRNNLAAVRDHTRVYKDFTYVYPVISRRSGGLSIGINLNPDKHCNFDCVYCEVDRKTPGKTSVVDLAQLRQELTALIHFARDGGLAREPKFDEIPPALTRTPRDIAFSGDGEPTMLHHFDECVRVAAEVKRAEDLDTTKLVLITDAAGLDTGSVKRGLEIMDANQGEVWAKLDAGTEGYYKLVNRTTVRLDRILHNLLVTARARPIIIQSLFLRMHGQPMPPEELAEYCFRLEELVHDGAQILEVHLYTIARPTPEPFCGKLTKAELEAMAATVRERTGLKVVTFD